MMAQPAANRSDMIQGFPIDSEIIARVQAMADGCQRILVCLDSNSQSMCSPSSKPTPRCSCHKLAPAATASSSTPSSKTCPRTCSRTAAGWDQSGPGDNPKTAVHQYLKAHPEFEIDKQIDHKLLISVAPEGYLRKAV
jgi:cephalosporin hydroxylase